MQEKNENLEKVLNDHTNKVFDLFQNRSKNFQTTFRILVSFAILFLFIILIPYASIKKIHEKTISGQTKLEAEIKKRTEFIATFQQIKDGILELHRIMERGPEELRYFILNLPEDRAVRDDVAQSAIQSNVARDETLDRRTRIRNEVSRRFDEYQSILQQRIYEPLRSLENDTLVIINLAEITTGFDSLKEIYARKLAENPQFWHTFRGKEEFYVGLDDDLEKFWGTHGAPIESQRAKLSDELPLLTANSNEMQQRLTDLQAEITTLDSRLKQIEFPFGKLPIGLDESVSLFPIILAIGFIICAGLLRDAIVLRDNFHRLYQQRDSNQKILTAEQIALIAPLWLDPVSSSRKQVGQFLLLATPFLIFLISSVLILNSWSISPSILFAGDFFRWFYVVLYCFSAILFLYGFGQVSKAVKSYASK